MDSLYEAVQESCEAQVYTIPSRSCSPAVLSDDATKWRSAGRSISMVTIERTAGMLNPYPALSWEMYRPSGRTL